MNETEFGPRILESFARQGLMRSIGARLVEVAWRRVVIEVPYADSLTQQNGYFHAAVSAAIGDTAGGYAAYTTMDASDDVLAVEFKINLLRPALGERLTAEGIVLKEGRTLTICQSTVRAWSGDRAHTVAVMMQTNMRMRPAPEPSLNERHHRAPTDVG